MDIDPEDVEYEHYSLGLLGEKLINRVTDEEIHASPFGAVFLGSARFFWGAGISLGQEVLTLGY